MKPKFLSLGLALVSSGITIAAPEGEAATLSPQELSFFEKKIRPVLVEKCYQCHSAEAEKLKGDLYLDTREGGIHGGETGPAVVPGDLKKSLLIEAIRYEDLEMPPKERLPANVVADFEKWISMGAPDPRASDTGAAAYSINDEIDYEEGRRYWAFQPVRNPTPPGVENASWPQTKLDHFILAQLEAKNLRPVADADRSALIRRVYFDLTGLPPTPDDVQAFLDDDSDNAFEKIVDRLLASRHYGERWGRHWMDIARYGESAGMERNFAYPAAWRYRDYIIASFNEDKPFNQFIVEQMAGDLIEPDSDKERDQLLVATGFLAIGPKSLNERDREQFKMDIVDEQIDVACRAVLGLTVSCARCHDHKFDPISAEDYYAMAGFFTNTRTHYGTAKGGGNRQPSTLMPIGDDSYNKAEALKAHRAKLAAMTRDLGKARKEMNNLRKTVKNKDQLAKKTREAKAEMAELQDEMKTLKTRGPEPPDYAMGVTDSEEIEEARLLKRGDVEEPAGAVPRAYPAVLRSGEPLKFGDESSGRLELARWMTRDENPLAARVMANRVWHYLFGQGIVRTVDNFGVQGEKPSHPELLDHLASTFVENDWSVKQLIRHIVTSRAYRLSSDHDDENVEVDPDNRLVWRMNGRRLDAESLRDAILATSGALDPAPATGSVVEGLGNANIGRDQKSLQRIRAAEGNRRSVYLPIVRNVVPEFLMTFDFAEPSILVGRRNVTTVPTQALYMMNSKFMLEQSALLADRILENEDAGGRIDDLYLLAFSRKPGAEERRAASGFVDDCLADLAEEKKDPDEATRIAWASLTQALLASAEFRYLN